MFLELETPIGTIDWIYLQCGDVKMQRKLYSLFRNASGVIQDDHIIATL